MDVFCFALCVPYFTVIFSKYLTLFSYLDIISSECGEILVYTSNFTTIDWVIG